MPRLGNNPSKIPIPTYPLLTIPVQQNAPPNLWKQEKGWHQAGWYDVGSSNIKASTSCNAQCGASLLHPPLACTIGNKQAQVSRKKRVWGKYAHHHNQDSPLKVCRGDSNAHMCYNAGHMLRCSRWRGKVGWHVLCCTTAGSTAVLSCTAANHKKPSPVKRAASSSPKQTMVTSHAAGMQMHKLWYHVHHRRHPCSKRPSQGCCWSRT